MKFVQGQTKVLEAGQSITVGVDGTLGPVVDMDPQEIQGRGGCFVGLHDVSLRADRSRANAARVEQMVNNDVNEADLPDVADPGGDRDFTPPPAPGDTNNPTLPPEVTTGVPLEMMDCGPPGLPGETCF